MVLITVILLKSVISKMWDMKSETTPVIISALGLVKKEMQKIIEFISRTSRRLLEQQMSLTKVHLQQWMDNEFRAVRLYHHSCITGAENMRQICTL